MKDRAFNRGEIFKWDIAPPPEYFEELFRVSKEQIIWEETTSISLLLDA